MGLAATKVPHAVLEAIGAPAPAGNVRTKGAARRSAAPEKKNGPVQIARPGIESWSCDDCGEGGAGWLGLIEHNSETGHGRFSAVEVCS